MGAKFINLKRKPVTTENTIKEYECHVVYIRIGENVIELPLRRNDYTPPIQQFRPPANDVPTHTLKNNTLTHLHS